MTLQQQIKALGLPANEGFPVIVRTGLGSHKCVLVVDSKGEQFVTFREPGYLQSYRVVNDSLRTHNQISRRSSIDEFDALCRTPVLHEFKTRASLPLRLSANVQGYTELIRQYLLLVPDPSDAQIHSLADSLAVDYQELEAQMFEMLGHCVSVHGASEDELVLEDKLDVRDAPAKTALLHDPGLDPVLIQEEQAVLNDIPETVR